MGWLSAIYRQKIVGGSGEGFLCDGRIE